MSIDTIIKEVVGNEFFMGVAGAGILASIIYQSRFIFVKLINFIKWKTVATITITSTDEIFGWVEHWLYTETPYGEKCRRMRVRTNPTTETKDWRYYDGDDADTTELSVGEGKHYIMYKGFPVKIQRTMLTDAKSGSEKINESIRISSFSRKIIIDIFDNIKDMAVNKDDLDVFVCSPSGAKILVKGVSPRRLDTIYTADGKIDGVCNTIEHFMNNRETYISKGIPWRIGLMLHGPPGTGKSSLARALATHYNRPITVINIASLNDNTLLDIMNGISQNSIVLMEDVDCVDSTLDRSKADSAQRVSMSGVTLSTLLNVIDGVIAPEGRILIMTTNHIDKIDPALTRPGRVDMSVEMPYINAKVVMDMVASFRTVDANDREEFINRSDGYVWSPSEVQKILLDNSVECIIESLDRIKKDESR